jgi:hypothetical protein
MRLAFIVSLMVLFVCTMTVVKAQDAAISQTMLTIRLPNEHPVVSGNRVLMLAQLQVQDDAGQWIPLARRFIQFYLDDEILRSVLTDENGQASIRIERDLPAGDYRVTAIYRGGNDFSEAQASYSFTVNPAIFEIRSVPSIAGINIAVNDQVFTTNEEGIARIPIHNIGTYQFNILPWDDEQSGVRVEFRRWQDPVFVANREIKLPSLASLEVGFNVSYIGGFSFTDMDDTPVDSQRISSLRITGSSGMVYAADNAEPQWLQSNVIRRRRQGLASIEIGYAVESVIVDGADVVNRGQQRFSAALGGVWSIKLLLYSMHVRAQDAFFGTALGTAIRLEYPNGVIESVPFNSDQEVQFNSLARGIYKLQVIGANGMATVTPVALSRDQTVELKVLSALDLAVVLGFGGVTATVLLLIGRPQILFFWKPKRSTRSSLAHSTTKEKLLSSEALDDLIANAEQALHTEHQARNGREQNLP